MGSSVVAGFLGAFLTPSWDLACPLRPFFRGSLHTAMHTSTCSRRISWLISSLASQLLCSWSCMSCLVSATAAPPQLAALLRGAAVLAVSKRGLFPSASSCKACSLAFCKELRPTWFTGRVTPRLQHSNNTTLTGEERLEKKKLRSWLLVHCLVRGRIVLSYPGDKDNIKICTLTGLHISGGPDCKW